MRKVIISCLTICAAIAVAEPALAHKRHGHRPHYHDSHRHCHYHSKNGYSHCHKHTHNGPGRGHHGNRWMHPIWDPEYFEYHFHFSHHR